MTYQMRRASGKPPKPLVDSPLNHGWAVLRRSKIDNAYIYGLDGLVEIRRSFDDPWNIYIGNHQTDGEGFELDLRLAGWAELTAKVRQEAAKKLAERDEPATAQEDYGLMGTR